MARSAHWSERREQATVFWVRVLMGLFKYLPMPVVRILTGPVALFYFLFAKEAREFSRLFLDRAEKALFLEEDFIRGTAKKLSVFRHFHAFAIAVVEKVASWGGKVYLSQVHFQGGDIADLIGNLERGEGALLICSHLGNSELLRALAGFNRTGVSRAVAVTSIVDFSVTARFNRMLQELNPASTVRIINANDIGPGTIILLQERIAAGELVVIAGDRTSAHTRGRCFLLPFLGEDAPFAYGPFFLAGLLNAPVYSVFALRRKAVSLSARYDMFVHRAAVSFDCPRKERDARIALLAREFAERLEFYCKRQPYQWFNFFDFWANEEA